MNIIKSIFPEHKYINKSNFKFTFDFEGDTYCYVIEKPGEAKLYESIWGFFHFPYMTECKNNRIIKIAEEVNIKLMGNSVFKDGDHFHITMPYGELTIEHSSKSIFNRFHSTVTTLCLIAMGALAMIAGTYVLFRWFRVDTAHFFMRFFDYSGNEKIVCWAVLFAVYLGHFFLLKRRIKDYKTNLKPIFLTFNLLAAIMGMACHISILILAIIVSILCFGRCLKLLSKTKYSTKFKTIPVATLSSIYASLSVGIVAIFVMFFSPGYRRTVPVIMNEKVIETRMQNSIDNLSTDNWNSLSKTQKLGIIQKIIDFEAVNNSTYSAVVNTADIEDSGEFHPGFNIITIDSNHLQNDSVSEVVNTALYEYALLFQLYSDDPESENGYYVYTNGVKGVSSYVENFSKRYAAERIDEFYGKYIDDDYKNKKFYRKYSEGEYDSYLQYIRDDDFEYTVHKYFGDENKSLNYITIWEYTGEEKSVVTIPDEIDSIPVKELDSNLGISGKTHTLEIGKNIEKIPNGAFGSYSGVITVDKDNAYFKVLNENFLIRKADNTLIFCNANAAGKVTLPNDISDIVYGCFTYNRGITDFVIKDSKYFYTEEGLLYNSQNELVSCPAAKTGKVSISSKCTAIKSGAFNYCNATGIQIPESVKEIGSDAFDNCPYLKNMVIPGTVATCSVDAISKLESLEEISISSSTLFYIGSFSDDGLNLKKCESLKTINFDGYSYEYRESAPVFSKDCEKITVNCKDKTITDYGD